MQSGVDAAPVPSCYGDISSRGFSADGRSGVAAAFLLLLLAYLQTGIGQQLLQTGSRRVRYSTRNCRCFCHRSCCCGSTTCDTWKRVAVQLWNGPSEASACGATYVQAVSKWFSRRSVIFHSVRACRNRCSVALACRSALQRWL